MNQLIRCHNCGELKSYDEFYSDKSKKNGKNVFCKKCVAEKSRERYWKMKKELFSHYSNNSNFLTCANCGKTDIELLELDHVDAGGREYIRQLGCGFGSGYYNYLKKNGYPNTPELQILCHDCNMKKEKDNNERKKKHAFIFV